MHDSSGRSDGNFVVVSCATLNPERFEVELFGAEKGVVAPYEIKGLLAKSHGGTLLLDEVADMPLASQAKFMSVLQDNRYQPVGANDYRSIDVRVIATTCKDLKTEIEKNRFRDDLYYRLNVVPFTVPPLRDYASDISLYIEKFSQQLAQKENRAPMQFNQDCMDILTRYNWPGNVRQLRNCVEWVWVMHANADMITPDMLPADIYASTGMQDNSHVADIENGLSIETLLQYSLKDARKVFERDYLAAQLEAHNGNVSKVADHVGMERSALHRKIKQLQIQ